VDNLPWLDAPVATVQRACAERSAQVS